jgi:hypothetical protein
MTSAVDPYRRHRPIGLGIHVRATDDLTGEAVTVRNHDLPSPELAWLRFDVARAECEQMAGDDEPEVVVELICGGNILDTFPMRRAMLPRLSVIINPPPPPVPGRYRVDLYATGRLVDGVERELGRAATIEDATRLYREQASVYRDRLVVLRGGVPVTACPIRRSDGKPRDLVI